MGKHQAGLRNGKTAKNKKTRGGYKYPGEDFLSGLNQCKTSQPTMLNHFYQNRSKQIEIFLSMLLLNLHIFSQSVLSTVSAGALIWDGISITKITVCGKQKFEYSLLTLYCLQSSQFLLAVHQMNKKQTLFLFLSVGLEKTQLWGFQNKITQKSFMEQSTFTLCLHCTLGIVLRCKRDEGFHGKISTMETSQC